MFPADEQKRTYSVIWAAAEIYPGRSYPSLAGGDC